MILKNYINRDIYTTTGAILMVLILIFVSSRFVKYIQLAVSGSISAKAVFSLLALQIPSIAGFLIPLSFFLSILLTFGRLYSDNELVVVQGLGIGEKRFSQDVNADGVGFSSFCWGTVNHVDTLGDVS
ncbi:MAG: LptF/LptG family permease [Enterobacterales bacterium]|nr:LptF/LptG family permease [Enterobacterales bacterium]